MVVVTPPEEKIYIYFLFPVHFDKLKCTEMDYELFGRFYFTDEDVLNDESVPLI